MNWAKSVSGVFFPSVRPLNFAWFGPQSGDCSCCTPSVGCLYFSDMFDRADSTALGSDWTETTGDWSIASNKLSVSSANARVDCNTTHPDGVYSLVIAVEFSLPTTNDQARIWFNNFAHRVVLTKSAAGGVVQITTGAGSVLAGVSYTGAFTSATICISPGGVVSVLFGTTPVVSSVVSVTSSVVGLGTGTNSGTITFDNFTIRKHGDHTPTCPTCQVSCGPCNSDTGDVVIDIPGGWTNALCSQCPDVVGEFNLSFARNLPHYICGWNFSQLWCSYPATLVIYLRIVSSGSNYKWRATVLLDYDTSEEYPRDEQYFESEEFLDTDCWALADPSGKITLSPTTGLTNFMCGGGPMTGDAYIWMS